MEVIKELEPSHARQLRHTFVQGRDGNYYKILTFQLYEMAPPPEFANYEVNVQKVDKQGRFNELVVPFLKRFKVKEDALRLHDELLKEFDNILKLEELKEEKHEAKEEGGH
jgi:hypothetical protein